MNRWTSIALASALYCLTPSIVPGQPVTARDGYRFSNLDLSPDGKAGFTRMRPVQTGVAFTNWVTLDRHTTNQMLLNGSGVAIGDVDGDGRCDLFFSALAGQSRLYRNLGGWKFEDVTARAGAACSDLDATGAALADLDGDGDLDLVVNSLAGGTAIFFNDGKGQFSRSPAGGGMNRGRGGTSLALADLDGDGDMDLYVANYRAVTIRDQPNTIFSIKVIDGVLQVNRIDGRPLTDPDLTNRFTFTITTSERGGSMKHDENGEADVLYLNDGRGNFSPVDWHGGRFLDEAGRALAHAPFDWGLSVIMRDFTGDGAPDIYVCNDFKTPDRMWINDGRGVFRAAAPLALRETCLSSMGIDVADLDRDGLDDLLVVDMLSREHQRRFAQRVDLRPDPSPPGVITNRPQVARNTLFLNRGDGTYAEIAQFAGLDAAEWAWTPIFLDVDLDGYEDLLVSNGFERDGMNMDVVKQLEVLKSGQKLSSLEQLRLRNIYPRLATANLAFRNLGQLKFADASAEWGFDGRAVSQGMAVGDLDNDGDLDVVVCNSNEGAWLYRNESTAPRVAVRLKGLPPNTRGIGGRIKVFGGAVPMQSQEMICGGRYLSSDDPMRVFAAGSLTNELRIEVTWRNGKRSTVNGAKGNRIYEIDEAGAQTVSLPSPPILQPLFQDVSEKLGHRHTEEPFDDFAAQPLLAHRLSQLGPGVSWFDLDGDGRDDLIIGSGKGGQLAAYRNGPDGGFNLMVGAPFNQPVTRDQTTVLGRKRVDGPVELLVGSANYEDGLALGSVARRYDLKEQTVVDDLPGQAGSTGPMAMADINGDGELDLFVGGRVISARYPEPASSMVFLGRAGKWTLDSGNTKRLEKVGLVSGAVLSDLDGDGAPELILACEWGPVKVFHNEKGIFTDATERLGLAKFTGWWTGVSVGDFDGDGRLDLVAANWGRNTKYETLRGHEPLRLYYGDLDGNGTVETIEACVDPVLKKLVPLQPLHLVASGIPSLQERFTNYEAYAKAGLEEIHGESMRNAAQLQANWFDSTVFLNRGGRFEARPLPAEAQFAPAFAVCVGDLDGDGHEDIFLSQNFFAVALETSRYDAGRGLLLKGDGQGGFAAVPGQQSGIKVYGEQRGAALCDYDGDGRVDVAVTQNAAETKLYRNAAALPGLRVRVIGPPGNSTGVGAILRLGLGPAREIHAGSGYWSQDSAVQVLARPSGPAQLVVRMPGGRTVTSAVPANASEVSIDATGKLTVIR